MDLVSVFASASTSGVKDIPWEMSKLLNDDLTTVKEELRNLFQKPSGG